MRVYGIIRKSDKLIVCRSCSRKQIFLLLQKRYDKEHYKIVVIERG